MVLPLEFLQKFKASDFPDPLEYQAWQTRNFKLLEAGLLVHPLVPLKKSDISAQRLHQIIHEAYDGQLETGRNSESMQRLRRAVMSLACRSLDEASDECHWADGFPLNLHIYKMLLEACFNGGDGTVVDEIGEVVELLKKTWVILGVNRMLHNLCFNWALFNHFVMLGQADNELLSATENLLVEVAKDAKITKDPDYCDVLSSTLSSIMGWTEKRLLAYHETFNTSNIYTMQDIVSIGISTAKILVEDVSYEYCPGTKEETDVVRSRIETYIRSSLRTAFSQKMEEVYSKRSSRNPTLILSILAKEIGDLATKEKNMYSPILKKWHPLAAGVAVVTLHACFGNELKQFIVRLTELTLDTAEVLKAADNLEKVLVHIAVADSVDSDDGGKSLVSEMPPYEAGTVIANLVKAWVKERVDKLKGWADQNLQQETWNPKANNRDSFAPSSMEMLHIIDETLDAFFQLPIPMHSTLLPDLTAGFDACLKYYVSKVKSGCGTRSTLFPQLPHLTRCDVGSKLFKKKEKPQFLVKRGSQVGSTTGNEASSLPGLCVRINTLNYIQNELENLDKKMKTCLQLGEWAQSDTVDGLNINFELSKAACQEGIRQLCETTAYKVIFNDLNHVLLDTLYVGSPASNRIMPVLRELGPILRIISATVHSRMRNSLITALMKASFDGFLLVLLAGGPTRAFSCQDYQIIEDDFRALRGLYLAYGDGVAEELVGKASSEVKNILPLLRTDTETLIGRFKQIISESYESTTKSRFPIPPVPVQWSPNNPNTILRVLCYRNDEAATKFLKKTYDLPKTL
ncbi:protein unc-13 homolog isoform X2 [Phragmites australis]|nr:protein unc-13 homolog isoform X2 [Phragmites australis]